MAQNNLFNIDLDEFQHKVIEASNQQLVLVDFWAEWCSPCVFLAPVLEKIADEFSNEISIAKLEVDEGENMKLAGQYKVRGFPTVILFKDGEEVDRFSSAQSFSFIQEFIQAHL